MRRPRFAGVPLGRLAVVLLLASVAGCGGGGGNGGSTLPVVVPVTSVTLQASSGSMIVGASQQLVAAARDANGAALSGRVIAWTTSNSAVASLSGTSGASLTVNALAVGTATIGVTSEGKSASVELAVSPVPVGSVVVTPASAVVAVGSTRQLTATTLDPNGVAMTGRTVTWTTSAEAVAVVSATGLVTGVAAGSASITATSEGKSASAAITVSSAPAPIISGIAPSLVVAGGTTTITGSNFAPSPSDNVVTIDDVPMPVITASSTELTVQALLPCLPAHTARVSVNVGGLTASGSVPVRAGSPVVLASGATTLLATAESVCAELPAGAARYLVSVVNTIQTPTSITPFRFQASSVVPSATAADVATSRLTPMRGASRPLPSRGALEAFGAAGATGTVIAGSLHEQILESNLAILARLRRERQLAGKSSAASRALIPGGARAVAPPAVNDVRTIRIRRFDLTVGGSSTCSDFTEITARVVYVGSRSIVLEDTKAPLAGTMDPYFVKIGQEMDGDMYDVVSRYFGDPLATDRDTDDDGHLSMVFSPSLTSGVAGFVSGCDLGLRNTTNNQSSNFGEYFYAVVPTTAGTGFSSNTPDAWLRSIRRTIVHEVKHIASFGARAVNNASVFEESWLEEGTARHSEELWLRDRIYHQAWKGAIGYRESAYCDVRPTVGECTGAPFGIFNHFAALYDVLAAPGSFSLFGRVADADFRFYAASWSFVRWAIDRHAATEADFLRGLTQSTTLSGMDNVAARTGRSADDMLAAWTLALYLDEDPAFASNTDTQIPTWNLRDQFRGMNQDFPQSFTLSYPLVPPDVPAGSFVDDNGGIHGGSFAMYLLTGAPGTPLAVRLGARAAAAGPSPTGLRVSIVRVP